MTPQLSEQLAELEAFGSANDAATSERPRRMLNITRDTGELLNLLVRATQAQRVLEIGTSNGYSTLWLAEAAAAIGGQVWTIEYADDKLALARANFAQAGLDQHISQCAGDAGRLLAATADAAYDLVFLDAERQHYADWWPDLRRVLRPGGLLVVDNALSHAAEIAPLTALIAAAADFTHCLVAVGNGELLATRAA